MLSSAAVRDEISGEQFSVSVKKFVNATGTGADRDSYAGLSDACPKNASE